MHCLSVAMVTISIAIQLHGNIARKTGLNTNLEIDSFLTFTA